MLKWLVLWTFLAVSATGDAPPEWTTDESSLFSHRNRRMINGTLVHRDEALWEVALRARRNEFWYYAGSGSIISKKWAVTVAHCVCNGTTPDAEIKAVSVGSIQAWGSTVHTIENIICHPLYRNVWRDAPIEYDIALIDVLEDFIFDGTTKPVSLPSLDGSVRESVGLARGWGSTQVSGRGMSQQLRSINMMILSASDCEHHLLDAYGISAKRYGQICARGLLGGYICFGDSGSSLTVHGVLVGIASSINGDECARTTDPAIFTSVRTFRNWIKDTTGL